MSIPSIHKKFFAFTLIAALVFWAINHWAPTLAIPGIEMGTVYALGIVAVLIILFVITYSARKRIARGLPGRLDDWLWAHIYLGLLALFIIALHADFRFSWDYHLLGVILLILVIVTGILGRIFYIRIPSKITDEQEDVLSELEEVKKSLNDILIGKTRPFQKIIGSELNTPSPLSPDPGYWNELRAKGEVISIISEEEKGYFEKAVFLLQKKSRLEAQSISQLKYKPYFKGWLFAHLFVTAGLIVMIPFHVLDDTFRVFRPTASDFGSAEQCRQCHQRQYDEWIGSMHAYAQASPVFVAFNEAEKGTGGGPFCVRCHSPIAIAIGEDPFIPNKDRAPISRMGVQCDSCHIINKNHGIVSGNIPLLPGRTKYGPFGSGKKNDPKAVKNSFHRSQDGSFLESSEFCGQCHDVLDPGRGFPIEEAFTEWKESVYAEKGITCQDCHMRALPGIAGQKKVMGPAAIMQGVKLPDRPLSDHSFIGPDNHLIDTFPYPDKPEENARIQRNYLEKKNYLLQNSAEMEIIAPDVVYPSSEFNVEVKVTNTGAGHGLPTGFTAERQVWIEIIVKDANDRVLFVSGDLDSNKDLRNYHSHDVEAGKVLLDEWLFNLQSKFISVPRRGVEVEVLRPSKAIKTAKNNIMPFESKSGIYPIKVPPDVEGPLKVDVRLRYRNLPPYILDFLGVSEHQDRLVINDMETGSITIKVEPTKSTRRN